MQIIRNLKHIFIAFLITYVALMGMKQLLEKGNFILPLTHFFVYQEGHPWLDRIYRYKFTPSKEIAIIYIDEASLNTLQERQQSGGEGLKMLTLNKDIYIELIEKLELVGVKGIAFDIIFENADKDEERFARVMQDYKNVVIGVSIDDKYNYIDGKYSYIHENDTLYGTKCNNCYPGIPRTSYTGVTWGLINRNPTHDRRALSVDITGLPFASHKKEGEREIDTLALALYKLTGGDITGIFPYSTKNKVVLEPFFGGDQIVGKASTPYDSFSLSQIFTLPILQKSLAGKYVFVGVEGEIFHDEYDSPVTGIKTPGVDSHAHFLDGILQKRFLKSWTVNNTLPFFLGSLLFMLVMVIFYLFTPKFVSIFIAIFTSLWMIWMSRFLYAKYAIVVDFAFIFMAGSFFSFPLTYIYRYFIIEKEKRMLSSAFSHYVDGRVVDQIARAGKKIELGGESRRLSILFSDIAGFTTLSEKLSPKDLFYIMSSYLSRMTNILTYHGGTLDKYIGDAVMGFYGAPLESDHHALDACDTALKMREALPIFNTDLLARGFEPIDFRIGIATGDVVVGNIGSEDRFNYTVLGDAVNLASRLEGTSKEYGTHILVSEPTYEDAKGEFFFRKLDKIAVKGKTEGGVIYELIANIRDTSIDKSIYTRYEEGLEKYFSGDYLAAGKIFESNVTHDPVSSVMMHRCLDILEGRVKLENGAYVMMYK